VLKRDAITPVGNFYNFPHKIGLSFTVAVLLLLSNVVTYVHKQKNKNKIKNLYCSAVHYVQQNAEKLVGWLA